MKTLIIKALAAILLMAGITQAQAKDPRPGSQTIYYPPTPASVR